MATQSRPPHGGSSRGLWVLILFLLAPAVVVPLVVPLYDKSDPTLFGSPFYFWFQFALIVMSAVLTVTAFQLSRLADRRDRAARDERGGER